MGMQGPAIIRAISKLRVAGLKIKVARDIPPALDASDAPAMWPRPDGFISDFEVTVDSFGSAEAKKTATYTLTYIFAFAPIGAGESFELFENMVTMAFKILDVVIAHDYLDGEAIDMTPSLGEFGPILDPSGNGFYGCEIKLAMTEFIN